MYCHPSFAFHNRLEKPYNLEAVEETLREDGEEEGDEELFQKFINDEEIEDSESD